MSVVDVEISLSDEKATTDKSPVLVEPGSGLEGDPLATVETGRRWLEDNAYDVRITSAIMLILVVLVGFYAAENYPFSTFLVTFFFFGKDHTVNQIIIYV